VHSFLAQAGYIGAILGGLALATLARFAGLPVTLVACGALFASTWLVVRRAREPTVVEPPDG